MNSDRKRPQNGASNKADKAKKKSKKPGATGSSSPDEPYFPLTSTSLEGRGRAFVARRAVAKGEVVLVCEPCCGVLLPHCVDTHCAACFRPVDGGDGAAFSKEELASYESAQALLDNIR